MQFRPHFGLQDAVGTDHNYNKTNKKHQQKQPQPPAKNSSVIIIGIIIIIIDETHHSDDRKGAEVQDGVDPFAKQKAAICEALASGQ